MHKLTLPPLNTLFNTLFNTQISYFDKHTASELTNLISVELDTIRSFIFKSVT